MVEIAVENGDIFYFTFSYTKNIVIPHFCGYYISTPININKKIQEDKVVFLF